MCCCFYFFATAPVRCCSVGSKIPARRLAPSYQSLSGTYSISANEGSLKHWSDYMNRVKFCWACLLVAGRDTLCFEPCPNIRQEINFTNKQMLALGKPVWPKKTKFISFSLRCWRDSFARGTFLAEEPPSKASDEAERENPTCHLSYEFWMPPTFDTLVENISLPN